MKRIILLLALAIAPTAQAQILVHDPVNLTTRAFEHASTVAKWVDHLRQLDKQFDKLKDTHDSLNGARDIADAYNNPELRRFLPDDLKEAYRAFRRSGVEGLVRKGIEIYEENQVFDNCAEHESDELRIDCESGKAHAAQTNADAQDALDVITERSLQIEDLQSEISSTEDAKTLADLHARIAAEQTSIQNETARLVALQIMNESQLRLDADYKRQLNARAWSGTKGVELEPLTFD